MINETLEADRAYRKDKNEAYERGYAQGKADAEPHWIPCSERLPGKEGYYLITEECLGFVGVDTRYYYTERDSGYWSLYENGTVIAWMPLPEPFKGVTE